MVVEGTLTFFRDLGCFHLAISVLSCDILLGNSTALSRVSWVGMMF